MEVIAILHHSADSVDLALNSSFWLDVSLSSSESLDDVLDLDDAFVESSSLFILVVPGVVELLSSSTTSLPLVH